MFQLAAKPKQMSWTLVSISLYQQKWETTLFVGITHTQNIFEQDLTLSNSTFLGT